MNVGDKVLIEGKITYLGENPTVEIGRLLITINRKHIKEVIPKPFDWKDAKQGMAFKTKDGYTRIFECWSAYPNADGEKVALCTSPQKINDQYADREHPSNLTRTPEKDLKL